MELTFSIWHFAWFHCCWNHTALYNPTASSLLIKYEEGCVVVNSDSDGGWRVFKVARISRVLTPWSRVRTRYDHIWKLAGVSECRLGSFWSHQYLWLKLCANDFAYDILPRRCENTIVAYSKSNIPIKIDMNDSQWLGRYSCKVCLWLWMEWNWLIAIVHVSMPLADILETSMSVSLTQSQQVVSCMSSPCVAKEVCRQVYITAKHIVDQKASQVKQEYFRSAYCLRT